MAKHLKIDYSIQSPLLYSNGRAGSTVLRIMKLFKKSDRENYNTLFPSGYDTPLVHLLPLLKTYKENYWVTKLTVAIDTMIHVDYVSRDKPLLSYLTFRNLCSGFIIKFNEPTKPTKKILKVLKKIGRPIDENVNVKDTAIEVLKEVLQPSKTVTKLTKTEQKQVDAQQKSAERVLRLLRKQGKG